mmetsp:Transcript_19673/g.25502  ORF Transcript_19673/g.25502 Transcript_19673/m.25502 type:complete len:176 (+) Transcript_19673:70-597(+)
MDSSSKSGMPVEKSSSHPSSGVSTRGPGDDRGDNYLNVGESCMDGDGETIEDSCTSGCPLFMDGLSTQFRSNPGLLAIASLLGEEVPICDDDEGDGNGMSDDTVTRTMVVHKKGRSCNRINGLKFNSGGGKATRRRITTIGSPYTVQKKERSEPRTRSSANSVNEAQLFLSMWKI